MAKQSPKFRVGEHVQWNSDAGLIEGAIVHVYTSEVTFKGYTHDATEREPMYLVQSEKTGRQALHKGSALKVIPKSKRKKAS